MKEKEKIMQVAGNWILTPLFVIQLLFQLSIISSPFVAIWHSYLLAWKIGLTGLFGWLISFGIYKFLEGIISEAVDEHIANQLKEKGEKKSFNDRLEEMYKPKNPLN